VRTEIWKEPNLNPSQNRPEPNYGTIVSIRGSVVDVRFPTKLPEIHNQLTTGNDSQVVIEVLTHRNPETARGIALTPTQGLARGTRVIDTGGPLTVPVGEQLLGRILNVFGSTIDNRQELDVQEWRSIHQQPVPLSQRVLFQHMWHTSARC
jgi:F-type H+-transporting ATPase subunit beta